MMELAQRYYAIERQTALVVIGVSLAAMLMALILWRTSTSASVSRGMAWALLAAGLFQAATCSVYVIVVNNRLSESTKAYSGHPEKDIKENEINRMNHVLKSGYLSGVLTFTASILIGLVLIFVFMNDPRLKGIALGLMIFGVLGHCIEAFSMQRNRQYLHDVVTKPVSEKL